MLNEGGVKDWRKIRESRSNEDKCFIEVMTMKLYLIFRPDFSMSQAVSHTD